MMSEYFRTQVAKDKARADVSLNLLSGSHAQNFPPRSVAHVVHCGAATSGDLAGHFGRDTIHVAILAWPGDDFTAGAGRTASANKRKTRRFTDPWPSI